MLCLGPMEAIRELNRRLEPHKRLETFLPFAELLDLFARYPVLVGAAHPFRAGGHIPEQSAELLTRLDFIDMNGKDIAEDRTRTELLTRGFGKALGGAGGGGQRHPPGHPVRLHPHPVRAGCGHLRRHSEIARGRPV